MRQQRIEEREQALAELEQRLNRKESEVAGYVSQVQAELDRKEQDWWQKQLGKPPEAA